MRHDCLCTVRFTCGIAATGGLDLGTRPLVDQERKHLPAGRHRNPLAAAQPASGLDSAGGRHRICNKTSRGTQMPRARRRAEHLISTAAARTMAERIDISPVAPETEPVELSPKAARPRQARPSHIHAVVRAPVVQARHRARDAAVQHHRHRRVGHGGRRRRNRETP